MEKEDHKQPAKIVKHEVEEDSFEEEEKDEAHDEEDDEEEEKEKRLKIQRMRDAARGGMRKRATEVKSAADKQRDEDARADAAGTRVFGVPVKVAAQRSLGDRYDGSDAMCPTPVSICMEWIRQNGLNTEGLFRIPGSYTTVNEYKKRFNSGEHNLEIPKDEAVENVASIVIKFLLELDPKLEGTDLYTTCYTTWLKNFIKGFSKEKNKEKKAKLAKQALIELGPHSCAIIRQITNVLKDAVKPEHSLTNKMSCQKFAVCIFPHIMEFAEYLIENHDDMFPVGFSSAEVRQDEVPSSA